MGNTLWALGLLFGTEDHRISFLYMGLSRGIATVLMTLAIVRYYNIRIDLPHAQDLKILHVRNIIMVAQGTMFAFCMRYLQPPIVYTIANAGPIIVFIIDYLMNGVAVSQKQFAGIVVSSFGILLAINSHMVYAWLGIKEDSAS